MDKSKTLTFFISIPEPYVDAIFKMANAHNKRHPDRFLTVDAILSDTVCQYVDRVEQMGIALIPANENQTTYFETLDFLLAPNPKRRKATRSIRKQTNANFFTSEVNR